VLIKKKGGKEEIFLFFVSFLWASALPKKMKKRQGALAQNKGRQVTLWMSKEERARRFDKELPHRIAEKKSLFKKF